MSKPSVLIQKPLRALFAVVMRSTALRKLSLQLLDKAPGLKIKLRSAYFAALSAQPDNLVSTTEAAENLTVANVQAAILVNVLSHHDDDLSSPLEKYSRSISLVRK